MGLGQILEQGTAQDAPLLLAACTSAAGQNTAAFCTNGGSGLFFAGLTSARMACSLGLGTAAGILCWPKMTKN